MSVRSLVLAVAILLGAALSVQAHFVWVAVQKDSGGEPAAQVWFSELAEPDSADLLDKIVKIEVFSRAPQQSPKLIQVSKQAVSGGGALIGPVPPGTPALSAQIKYGVLTRGEQTFLLRYYAKYLDGAAAAFNELARDERLLLDIVPRATDKGYSLQVLYQGQPVAGSSVVIHDPSSSESEAKSDEQGRFDLATLQPGLYSIRAKWVVAEAGQEGEKKYGQVNHYCTLALRVPAR
jgi:uncharacterized GH25 family protein